MSMTAIKIRLLSLLLILQTLVSTNSWAQDEDFKKIQQRFEKLNQYSLQEKLYLHTDKSFYLAGEIIWFKVYYADGATHRPINFSKIAYVEVLDRTNKRVLQAKISLTEKGGTGSFYLPLTLNSDNYTIKAYTNWMKNSGVSSFFDKSISIVNTIKPNDGKFQPDSLRAIANFFPEGGNLVQDIETKVAFHIVDQYGKGMNAQGVITNDNGDTVQHFSSRHFGIGNFMLKPLAGQNYKATIVLPGGKSFTGPLPKVYDYGYVMNITDNKDGRLKVRIQGKGKEVGQRGEKVFLLGHTRQVLKIVQPGYVNYENDLVIYVDKAKLEDGVSHFTLFNKDQQPVCERLIFKRPENKSLTSISSDKPLYEKRQKVDISISPAVTDSTIDSTNFSVAVFQLDSLQQFEQEDIESYFWLTSDLRGSVESPGFYFTADAGVAEATDNLLLTHGWRRFRWENVLSSASPVAKFLPEYRGHIITAKVTGAADGKAADDIECFLSFAGNPYGFYAARTNNNGMVYFDVKNYYGPGEIIVQAGRDTVSRYRVDILTPFVDEYPTTRMPFFAVAKKEEKKLVGKSIGMQAQNIYGADSIRRFNSPVLPDTLPFFGKAEYTYRLDEYKRFTTMEEVLREYVMPINVVLRNGRLHLSVFDLALKSIYTDQVLVLIDGVPLMDYNKIFFYDPLKVKKLDVVPTRYQIGGINFKGIASFETYQGKFDGFELTPGVVAVDYEGLQMQREFYSPVYETNKDRQKRIPDLRSTLYWKPDVSTGITGRENLRFYTSDQPGKFLIVLQGFNAIGEPVSATSSFIVE